MVNDTIEKGKRKKKRKVNTRDKIHHSNTAKPHPCLV